MGNGSVYEKTAEDANAPYTILEDFTKEMHSNSARIVVVVAREAQQFPTHFRILLAANLPRLTQRRC
ncbi:hypothetical protein PC128_g1491 [Phytophthora cactorum]|nr:hypothetical protein PC128_g1491 [Phytophthora cactorum]